MESRPLFGPWHWLHPDNHALHVIAYYLHKKRADPELMQDTIRIASLIRN